MRRTVLRIFLQRTQRGKGADDHSQVLCRGSRPQLALKGRRSLATRPQGQRPHASCPQGAALAGGHVAGAVPATSPQRGTTIEAPPAGTVPDCPRAAALAARAAANRAQPCRPRRGSGGSGAERARGVRALFL
ncbi:hypothetical protein GW17_00055132 [Ensete ventricosum]|nr:hypothetical protein GW17_00055132 [Ensete ventricosum]